MRPLALWRLAFCSTTLPAWPVVRIKQQWQRLPGTRRRMVSRSRACASASHASTTSFRRIQEECEPNPKHWLLPKWPSQVRLAFKWEIVEGCSTTATEAASCVVRLDKAENQGVPLPTGWGPKVAALLDGSLQSKGTLRGLSAPLELLAQCIASVCWPGAPTDHGPTPPAEEADGVDRQLLHRRALAAAEAAALRYEESCGGRVYCTLVGQLRFERDDWPRLSDCERDLQRWILPDCVDRLSLINI